MEYSGKAFDILEASRKLFSKEGFKAVTTREIAKEAGVNEVTIFRLFQSKENLFEQVISQIIFKPKISEYINNNEQSLNTYLYGVGNLIHTIISENMDLFKIELVESQRMQNMNLINRFPNEIKEGMINFLINKQGKSETESIVFAVSFMTAVHGLCMNLYFLKTFTPAPDFNECLDFIVKKFS
jgi:TetR/AcrR family transcriptional regulator, mexJK operon transcriptional repressor